MNKDEQHSHNENKHEHTHSHENGHTHSHDSQNNKVLSGIKHFFKPHSHDSADSIDDALEGSRQGIKAVKNSLYVLGVTAVFQLIIVLFSGSIALLADTIHNFADASTAIPLWLAFSLGKRAANNRYSYGYGRAEDIAGIFVIIMIAGSSLLAFWETFQRLLHPQPITNLLWVAIAAIIGFIGNELVAQYRIKTGNKIGSAALVADGYHARTDGFTSLAVLLGVIGTMLGFPKADPLVGLGITIAIAFVLKDAAVQVWHRLMDAVDPKLKEDAIHAASHVNGVQGVTSVRMRWIGHSLEAEAIIVTDASLSVSNAHSIAEEARHAMFHAVPKLVQVIVHVDPSQDNGKNPHANLEHHDKKVAYLYT